MSHEQPSFESPDIIVDGTDDRENPRCAPADETCWPKSEEFAWMDDRARGLRFVGAWDFAGGAGARRGRKEGESANGDRFKCAGKSRSRSRKSRNEARGVQCAGTEREECRKRWWRGEERRTRK